jgi:hypothetical protein
MLRWAARNSDMSIYRHVGGGWHLVRDLNPVVPGIFHPSFPFFVHDSLAAADCGGVPPKEEVATQVKEAGERRRIGKHGDLQGRSLPCTTVQ